MGLKLRDIAGYGLAPFTGGASLLMTSGAKKAFEDITGQTSARKQNERQEQLQKATNDLSIELANTAHQREVADLKEAGLNPVLSAGGSGAVTPTLGTAQIQNELPGGLMSQATQAAGIMGTLAGAQQASATAKQAETQANLNNVNAEIQPELAKAKVASDFANAGSAKAVADYTNVMKDVDKSLKEAETETTKKYGEKLDKTTPYGGKTMGTIKSAFETMNEFTPIKILTNSAGAVARGLTGM